MRKMILRLKDRQERSPVSYRFDPEVNEMGGAEQFQNCQQGTDLRRRMPLRSTLAASRSGAGGRTVPFMTVDGVPWRGMAGSFGWMQMHVPR